MAGRTVVVTGATSGIGKATAVGLAALGARVAVTGRDPGRAETVAGEVRAAGGTADVFVADLSSQAEVRRLADELLRDLPRIDVLVNNVGEFTDNPDLKQAMDEAGVKGVPRFELFEEVESVQY